MAISSTYTGNGSAGPFTIGFAYLNVTDVKVEVDSVLQTQGTNFTVAGSALTFTSGSEPANGAVIYIYRDTASASPVALFSAGAPIKAADLNNNYTQNRYVAEEADSKSDDAVSTSNTAKTTADSAVTTANSAVTTANTAASDASSAVTTANTAASDAASAVTTANSATTTANNAVTTANSAVTTANTAASDAASAVTTANTAATDAASAVTTANTASTNASNAVTTANTAASDASTALSTANTAASDASTALSTANTAATNASTAITTANTAATDAASAVTTANTAASDAASAVTTANTAASDASSAVTTANTAATDASNAVSTANAASAAVSGKLDKSGGTMTGAIDMGSNLINAVTDPVSAQDAATKNYVDTEISGLVDSAPGTLDTLNELAAALGDDANFSTTVTNSIATKLPLAGGTMSGAINMGSNLINAVTDPVSAQDAATKNYVDTQNSTQDTTIATKLPLAGGTMSGAIDMGSNLINNVTDPASAQDAATKNYVDTANSTQDTAIAAKLPLSGGTMTGDITFNSGQTIDGYICLLYTSPSPRDS